LRIVRTRLDAEVAAGATDLQGIAAERRDRCELVRQLVGQPVAVVEERRPEAEGQREP
jgi:hypothetical protein